MRAFIILSIVAMLAGVAGADLIWQEDFSDVSDWALVWDEPTGESGGTITSDGTYGLLYVDQASAKAAFSPTAFMTFNEAIWDTYTLSFDVNNITWSLSYQVDFDQYDSGYGYLSAVTLYPNGTFVGTTNYSLADASWDASAAYVRPKVTVFIGDGAQTLTMNDMQLNSTIPEPATILLASVGFAAVGFARRRRR